MLDSTPLHLCIVLDYDSSLLTTFNTQWARYQIVLLSWGLACAQDIFQYMMDQILDHWDCVIGIADDVVINVKDDKVHGRYLHRLMEVAHEHSLVFNGGKCVFKQPSMTFFGCVYDKDGAYPDPAKVSVVQNMPPSETPTQLKMFLSMVTYLSPFLPSLLSFTAPLYKLIQEGHRIYIESITPGSFWHCELPDLHRHYPNVLQCL